MKTENGSRAKRAFDLLVCAGALPFALPVSLVVGIAVLVDSRGPILYRATRVGGGGVSFEMLKFRTMRLGAMGGALAGAGDQRVTRVGRFLRRSRLDELPQLVNVVRGEMSIVGPRPELEEFVALHADEYDEILSVPPGITGPTQLLYAGVEAQLIGAQTEPERFYRETLLPDKVALDLAYARGHSFAGDFLIICRTLALPLALARRSH